MENGCCLDHFLVLVVALKVQVFHDGQRAGEIGHSASEIFTVALHASQVVVDLSNL